MKVGIRAAENAAIWTLIANEAGRKAMMKASSASPVPNW